MPTTTSTNPAATETPRVLVLLATCNGAPWIAEQLDGILGQRRVHVTVLAADDGSTDGTAALVLQRACAQQAVHVLPPSTRKLGAAGNFLRLLGAAALGDFDYVALADQDDIWPPDRLAIAIESLASHAAVGYSSDAVAFWADGRRRALGKAGPQRKFDHLFEPAGPGCTYVLSVALARAFQEELHQRPDRFEGLGYHDWVIYAFARTHGYRWFIDTVPSVWYRQHERNELGANVGLAGLGKRWQRLRSAWFRQQVLQIAGLWPGAHHELFARVQRFAWRDRIWIALRAPQLRRRPRDQWALAAMILLGVMR
jgi:rhamnosyltransferase